MARGHSVDEVQARVHEGHWSAVRGEARLLVFSMGWNFWLGAELFSRLNSFVFAPRVQSSSSETAGPFRGLLFGFAGGAGCGLRWAGGPRQRLSEHLFLGFASPRTQGSSCRPARALGTFCFLLHLSGRFLECPDGHQLQTRDPLLSARGGRLPCPCSAL